MRVTGGRNSRLSSYKEDNQHQSFSVLERQMGKARNECRRTEERQEFFPPRRLDKAAGLERRGRGQEIQRRADKDGEARAASIG